jgi:hypothetical protein
MDRAGNPFAGVGPGGYKVSVAVQKDNVAPSLLAAEVGDGGSPNPSFDSNHILLFFSEVVQRGFGGGDTKLVGSDGGDFCDGNGACHGPGLCESACGYTPATLPSATESFTFSGNQVKMFLPGLSSERGYKLIVEEGAFLDIAGNKNIPFDGIASEHGYVLRFRERQIIEPVGVWPEDGMTMVPLSTSLVMSFSETVQSGVGGVIYSIGSNRTSCSCVFFW